MNRRGYKTICIIIVCLFVITALIGCGSSKTETDKFVEKFVNTYYTVGDYSKMTNDPASFTEKYNETYSEDLQAMISQQAFERDLKNRGQIGLFWGSVKNKFNIKVTDFKIDKVTDKGNETYLYDYYANLNLEYSDRSEIQKIYGQVTLKKEDGSLIIDKINKAELPVKDLM